VILRLCRFGFVGGRWWWRRREERRLMVLGNRHEINAMTNDLGQKTGIKNFSGQARVPRWTAQRRSAASGSCRYDGSSSGISRQ